MAAKKNLFLEALGLQTARGRVIALGLASFIIFILPYSVVGRFSLLARLGWETAPSVGLTRSYWLLMHGDPVAAWHRNWLIFPILGILLVIIGRDIWSLIKASSDDKRQTEK